MEILHRVWHFILYQWQARTKYYLHSPFVYRFYLDVVESRTAPELANLNQLRDNLARSERRVFLQDFGTGKSREIGLSELESRISVRHKYGEILYRMMRNFKPETVLELGTCIGLSAAYMATAIPNAQVVSIEGSESLIVEAKENHRLLSIRNVDIVQGNITEVLPNVLRQMNKVDFVFIDGNHNGEATIQYFEQCLQFVSANSIIVIDDIYWSRDMTLAWERIKSHHKVRLTIDLYQFGICFFRKENLENESFVLRC